MPHGSQFVESRLGSWENVSGRTALICTTRPVVLLHWYYPIDQSVATAPFQIGHVRTISRNPSTMFLLKNERNYRSMKWSLGGRKTVDINVGATTSSEIAWYGL